MKNVLKIVATLVAAFAVERTVNVGYRRIRMSAIES